MTKEKLWSKLAQYCSYKKLQGHDSTPSEHKGKAASNIFHLSRYFYIFFLKNH